MSVEHQFFVENPLSEYTGKWVAIVGKKVIAADVSLRNVHEIVKRREPEADPLFAKVPGDEICIL